MRFEPSASTRYFLSLPFTVSVCSLILSSIPPHLTFHWSSLRGRRVHWEENAITRRHLFWRTKKCWLTANNFQLVCHNTTNIGEPEKVWQIWSVTVSLRPCLSFTNSAGNTSQLSRMVSAIGHGLGPLKSLPQIETISSEQSDCSQQSSQLCDEQLNIPWIETSTRTVPVRLGWW